jgi:tungstate transport system ATP-binding protein
MEELIRIEDIIMSFGGKDVLKDINLQIFQGEIFALVGPSGAGKTTLLRILALFERPEKGNLKFNGMETSGIVNIRRRMSLLFQTPAIFNRSVFENVAYGLKVRGIDKKIIDKKVREALSIVGLCGLENQNAPTLSGGEAQRMAFARAIVYDPEILLLDEPTANLDPANVMKIEDIIKWLREEKKTTILLATHNIPQVQRLADRVGILINGELIEVHTKDAIFKDPKDKRSAAFLKGEMIY